MASLFYFFILSFSFSSFTVRCVSLDVFGYLSVGKRRSSLSRCSVLLLKTRLRCSNCKLLSEVWRPELGQRLAVTGSQTDHLEASPSSSSSLPHTANQTANRQLLLETLRPTDNNRWFKNYNPDRQLWRWLADQWNTPQSLSGWSLLQIEDYCGYGRRKPLQ